MSARSLCRLHQPAPWLQSIIDGHRLEYTNQGTTTFYMTLGFPLDTALFALNSCPLKAGHGSINSWISHILPNFIILLDTHLFRFP